MNIDAAKQLRVGDRIRGSDEGTHWHWTVQEQQERGVVVTAMNGNGHRHLKDWCVLAQRGFYNINPPPASSNQEGSQL